jgi:hypothetical protein
MFLFCVAIVHICSYCAHKQLYRYIIYCTCLCVHYMLMLYCSERSGPMSCLPCTCIFLGQVITYTAIGSPYRDFPFMGFCTIIHLGRDQPLAGQSWVVQSLVLPSCLWIRGIIIIRTTRTLMNLSDFPLDTEDGAS